MSASPRTFERAFEALTGNSPFPWQAALYERLLRGDVPVACDLPTGLGKTSVIALWLLARASGAALPTRLVYVVNRRTVVDQTTEEVERLRARLGAAGIDEPLAISTLRGQMADNREWSEDPSRHAVICGTVDMVGSRLLFGGYGVSFRLRPLHAGFLGQDALLVHDEAHLEPAFQALLEAIVEEQRRSADPLKLRVMALSATARSGTGAFELVSKDMEHPTVRKRFRAPKALALHETPSKKLADLLSDQVLAWKDDEKAVVVFVRSVEDVEKVSSRLAKAKLQVQRLTGTLRGFERDRLVASDPVFARFLPGNRERVGGTVALVCTSAGEVGVNLSADHLVSDLSTFDSMAQRFGRVNRFGERTDSEVHVFHPPAEELSGKDLLDHARARTLTLLKRLANDASPAALRELPASERTAAFAPAPALRTVTDILLDAWSMTSVRGRFPGRPPLGEFLHGLAEWEPPHARVAWRTEVHLITGTLLERYPPAQLLEYYPLKPHECLSDRADRVADTLLAFARRDGTPLRACLWIQSEEGDVDVVSYGELAEMDRKSLADRLAAATVLLSPRHLPPQQGFLTSEPAGDAGEQGDAANGDVADAWLDAQGQPRRRRVFDSEAAPDGMRHICTLELRVDDADTDEEGAEPRRWSWYEQPHGGDEEGSRSATKPVALEVHSRDVERHARDIVARTRLPEEVKRAVILAARHHDHGKNRPVWQRSIGNAGTARLLAKPGRHIRASERSGYRHELGSMLDAQYGELLEDLSGDARELALHLIAAHHGRARPHFPDEELLDPGSSAERVAAAGVEVAERFVRLQRRYGRWGLAYLESLVRAADYAASAAPSAVLEEVP